MKKYILTWFIACVAMSVMAQQAKTYVIKADSIKAHVQPTMYGIFFEDINMAADGGLYAELIKNRSFEFVPNLMGWTTLQKGGGDGSVEVIDRTKERPENPHYVTLTVKSNSGYFGLSNEGFRGIGIKKGETYIFSVMARQHPGSKITLNVQLVNADGAVLGKAALTPSNTEWEKCTVRFAANTTTENAHFDVLAKNSGAIDLDMVSLFPQHTWKNRPGGLRADLVQKLADMKPGFLRFPGGCIVEGRDLANRYQWKKTIGDIDKRENLLNRWNVEFKSRSTPDYYQSFGLGFLEYFQLAEDIGAEPLPILNCGMACQFNSGQTVPLDQLDPYVQDALDLVEFANGSTDTKWGKLRTELGHPKPFNLKLMGVGNEQWGENYIPRWKIFTKAIKDKYPYMQLVSSVGPDPDGEKFDYLNKIFREQHADILDEHYYRSPQWFLSNAARYDNYDRNGPKIFAGEYAAHAEGVTDPYKKNNWQCAMAEAAFMTGLERNADVVKMASYAPLFANINAWQWAPDAIWFDNLHSYSTPDYYVQQLYSLNKGTDVVSLTLDKQPVTGQNGEYASAVLDNKTHTLIIKFVNTANETRQTSFVVKGKRLKTNGTLTILHSDSLGKVNSIQYPKAISPKQQYINVAGNKIKLALKPYSFNIIRVNYSK